MTTVFKQLKADALLLLVLAFAAALASCMANPNTQGESSQEPSSEPMPEATAVPEGEAALAAYREIVANADAYDYGAYPEQQVTGYRYALVHMQSGDNTPTLLLAQEIESEVEYVRVFRYDPETGKVLEPVLPEQDGALMQGDASRGGFRGVLSLMDDGSGICANEFYSGTGDGTIRLISAHGNELSAEKIWSGNVTEDAPFAVSPIENWFDAADPSGLAG